MELDLAALLWAKVENLERLARALRVALPLHLQGDEYRRALRKSVAWAIEHDRRRDAEERRAMETAEAEKVAREIADAIGENGGSGQAPRARVEAQLTRMALLMGEAWVRDTLEETEQYWGLETLGQNFRADGVNRTYGGAFFATARFYGHAALRKGQIKRRDFYSTFCWRERAPKAPRPPKPAPRPIAVTQQKRQPGPLRPAVVEVYQVRRRA